MERYKHLNSFLKEKFGERTLKICVDGGFTCPNRDGSKGTCGCIFCGASGSGENIKFKNIKEQVKNHLNSYRGQRANKFIVYFQNFSNTYDTVEVLKEKYNSALIDKRIVGLAVATRPDCITEEVAKLLFGFSKKIYVCVELGLQTSNEKTGELINRAHNNEDFSNAVKILNKYNIDIVSHIMLGLPNETIEDVKNTVDFLNSHNLSGIKIHCTYVIKNTKLEKMYKAGEYVPLSFEEFMEQLVFVITHISPNFVIHRITADPPKELLIAPNFLTHKKWVLNGLDKILRENDLYQGIFYN